MKITHVVVGVLASSVLVAGCVVEDAAVPVVEVAVEDDTAVPLELRIVDQPYVFNQEFFDELFRERSPDAINRNLYLAFPGWSWGAMSANFKVESVEFVEDDLGPYARYKVALHEEYLDLIPMEYYDGSPITEFSKEDIKEAVRFYSNYSLNEYIDSPALDNPDKWDGWWENGGKDYFLPQAQEYILSIKQEYDPSRKDFEDDESAPFGYYSVDSTVPMVYLTHDSLGYGDSLAPKSSPNKTIRGGVSRTITKGIADLTFENASNNTILISGTVKALLRIDYDKYWQEREKVGSDMVSEKDFRLEGTEWRENYGKGLEEIRPVAMYVYMTLTKNNGSWKIAGMGYGASDVDWTGQYYDMAYADNRKYYSENTYEEWRYERFIEYVPAR